MARKGKRGKFIFFTLFHTENQYREVDKMTAKERVDYILKGVEKEFEKAEELLPKVQELRNELAKLTVEFLKI